MASAVAFCAAVIRRARSRHVRLVVQTKSPLLPAATVTWPLGLCRTYNPHPLGGAAKKPERPMFFRVKRELTIFGLCSVTAAFRRVYCRQVSAGRWESAFLESRR